MKRFVRAVVLAVLMLGVCAGAAGQGEYPSDLRELRDSMRLWMSEKMVQAESQFLENREAFQESADALAQMADVCVTYEPEPAGDMAAAYPVLRGLATVNGRQLYVLSKKELTREHMALLRESGTVDLFSKTGCWEIVLTGEGILYWWQPALFFGGGLICTQNPEGFASSLDIQKELDEGWVTFWYPDR